MLEEMGITPDVSVREKRPSLKAAGHAIIATIRMRKMQQAWAGSKKLHESLLKKLESMKARSAVAA
ncbi:hypothetical protein K461DRAFT_276378 [Myriangium duriaei CBS 260.36]|uniref:Pericentrin/AKAP-450 centrosomal targeting domain-containing protein n=1 Tax=Myriangium duriaei CBS 260.36 TaxID=1168546 RepID=A0A9P4J5I5_9PEZI|nr:hypothetical protein K461DRAFT_276378 [Myriangium duriaei CBS 260.36]